MRRMPVRSVPVRSVPVRSVPVLAVATAVVALTTSCSLVGGDDDSASSSGSKDVVLVTHSSFVLPKKLIARFDAESGYHLVVRASGDAGELTNRLVLTKSDPTGDVSFGVDNTFGSRAVDAGVFAPYDAPLPAGAAQYDLPGDADHDLTPIDTGNVCVNVDDTWFADHDVAPPTDLADLAAPRYRGLMVTPGATTSSPGLAFLLTTVAAYGDQWPAYWTKLLANGLQVVQDWTQAYEVDFTQGGGSGDKPIVVSYDSSPAFTTDGSGGTTTSALLDTCFRQIEYAGVLAGAQNPAGAKAFVDFMLTREVQQALPDAMYVFPVDSGASLPTDWATFAQRPTDPYTVDPAEIAKQRDTWLQQWSDLTSS